MGSREEKGSVKKTFWLISLGAALAAIAFAVYKVFFVDSRERYNFKRTDDPNKVIDQNGNTVDLPKTKSGEHLTSDKIVAAEKAPVKGTVEVQNAKDNSGNAVGTPVAGSAGEVLFGKRG